MKSNPSYQKFLEKKFLEAPPTGLSKIPNLSKNLFGFQRDIVAWALRLGRAAIFADCGMGKTLMQLEWARHIPGDVLILAPLAVAGQTVREGHKFGIAVNYCRKQEDTKDGINITNYEMLEHFDPEEFEGIVLDESSILKSFDGKTRTTIIDSFQQTPYRLACTATPSPNDYTELGNHSEFLGVMTRAEMLSMFFCHDGGETQKWRLKGHAENVFWGWICSWAVMISKPSDLGHNDKGFILPKIKFHEHIVRAEKTTEGMLFAMPASSLQERIGARRDTIIERVNKVAEIVNGTKHPWIVWCQLNSENDLLLKKIKDSVSVKGSDSMEIKESRLLDFSTGKIKRMISKASIAGHGLNWQHCANMVFVGASDSYEQFYQAVRRCWRFGQKNEVSVHLVSADTEGAVLQNIRRKEADAKKMMLRMVENMKAIEIKNVRGGTRRKTTEYNRMSVEGKGWTMHLGDCIDVCKEQGAGSIDYSIYSPPFASLYTYSNSDRDMGNCKGVDDFMEHYRFLVADLLRVTLPGRLTSFHCMNLPTSKVNDGIIGIRDFRGELIRVYRDAGWIFHSEVVIWKDPVVAMQRTKALGLLHKQIKKDSCMSRQGIPDYVVTMRKPGDNPKRVNHTNESFPVEVWQQYASPIWMDINPSDTLQKKSAREHKDERHICPLQLEVIRRCLRLWSRPDDLVFSPFAGIGSEGYIAVQMGRRFLGAELKESYFKQATANLKTATEHQLELK